MNQAATAVYKKIAGRILKLWELPSFNPKYVQVPGPFEYPISYQQVIFEVSGQSFNVTCPAQLCHLPAVSHDFKAEQLCEFLERPSCVPCPVGRQPVSQVNDAFEAERGDCHVVDEASCHKEREVKRQQVESGNECPCFPCFPPPCPEITKQGSLILAGKYRVRAVSSYPYRNHLGIYRVNKLLPLLLGQSVMLLHVHWAGLNINYQIVVEGHFFIDQFLQVFSSMTALSSNNRVMYDY